MFRTHINSIAVSTNTHYSIQVFLLYGVMVTWWNIGGVTLVLPFHYFSILKSCIGFQAFEVETLLLQLCSLAKRLSDNKMKLSAKMPGTWNIWSDKTPVFVMFISKLPWLQFLLHSTSVFYSVACLIVLLTEINYQPRAPNVLS